MNPFNLTKVEHLEEGWEPDIYKEYLVQYRWRKAKRSIFLVGSFSKVWFGYTFHWYWGASSLQLSMREQGINKDIEYFMGIWEVERLPEPENKKQTLNFITKEDIDDI